VDNALTETEDSEALPPSVARIRLDTLSTVRTEMAKLYRLARAGKLELGSLGKLVYTLKEIRCCLEAEALERMEQRMDEIAQKSIARITARPGHETFPRPH
jgi:hypothetical protein